MTTNEQTRASVLDDIVAVGGRSKRRCGAGQLPLTSHILALLCGGHSRCGALSPLSSLPLNVLQNIALFLSPKVVVVARTCEREAGLLSMEALNLETGVWSSLAPLRLQYNPSIIPTCSTSGDEDNTAPLTSYFNTDSKMLYLVGGPSNVEGICDCYNVLTNTWQSLPRMNNPRSAHTTNMMSGRVLVIGGITCRSPANKGALVKTVEEYDPSLNEWLFLPPLELPRFNHASCVIRNSLLVSGGYTQYGGHTPGTQCISKDSVILVPAYNTDNTVSSSCRTTNVRWVSVPQMCSARQRHTLTLNDLGSMVYCVGGVYNKTLKTTEVFDVGRGEWSALPDMHCRRFFHTSTWSHGRLYVIGGYKGLTPISVAEAYDPRSGTWEILPEMAPRAMHSTYAHGDRLFVLGGNSDRVDVFNAVMNCWEDFPQPLWASRKAPSTIQATWLCL
ncbi:branched-chain amino acid ABC transporter substrate-binding protein [Pelomyxa schiedti]|nr:branched-chain amino acid ABC transporter substrate-binding protein [Pelomyxa schiedti]